MRVTPFAVVLSIVIAVLGILLLIALPGPGVDRGIVDRHTGQLLDAPDTVLLDALSTGNAVSAAHILESLPDARRDDPDVVHALSVIESELAATGQPALDDPVAPVEALFSAGDRTPVAGIEPVDHAAVALLERLEDGRSVPAAELLQMAETFDRHGRARARDRWLRRALASAGDSFPVRLAVARVFVREGRLDEAAAVTDGLEPPAALARDWWSLRADLGLWLGRYSDEAFALTELLRDEFDESRARRLIEVQRADGQMELAARTALSLGAATGRAADLEAAADAALSAGLADEGREALGRLLETAADPAPWQRRLARLELQDLRFDRAREHLEAVFERGHDPLDERALEDLYRRRQLRRPLTDLLLRRWSAATPGAGSPVEVLHLLVAGGRREQARELLTHLAAADLQPAQFGRLLPWFVDEGIADLASRAEAMAARVGREDVPAFVDGLEVDPRFTESLAILARRFPDDDAVFEARVNNCWTLTGAGSGLAVARTLASERPRHLGALRVLAAHASDAKDVEEELRATDRIYHLLPDDRDNAVQRAWALHAIGRHDQAAAAWAILLAAGFEPARRPLFDSLIAAGRLDEVAARVADWRGLEPTELLELGDALSAAGRGDLAEIACAAILRVDPGHPAALLRAGLLRTWADDPAGALPFLLRRYELSEADRSMVGFHIGEALWALGRRDEAVPHYERALVGLADVRPRDAATGVMLARSLHRVGRIGEAIAAYEDLLRAQPDNQALHLDLAELSGEAGQLERAATAIANARALGSRSRRFLRAEASYLLRRGDPLGASRSLLASLDLHEPDAAEVTDLSTAYEHLGEFGAALANYQRWSALQRSSDSMGAEQRMRDRLATHFGFQGGYRAIGDDASEEFAAYGATTWNERTRIQGRAGWGEYRGRSQAVGGGAVDVVTETALLDLGVVHRHGPGRDQVGGGVRLHPDAAGGNDFGAWLEAYWEQPLPSWSLSVRFGVDELWTEPAAAAGLGGRRTGVALTAYRALLDRGWLSIAATGERVRARVPFQAGAKDERATADLQLGWRWTDRAIAMADPFRVDRAPAGPESPWLGDGPDATGRVHLATWLGFTADHVLGDAAITTVLPVSETVHFVYAAARADSRLTGGLGVSVDGLVGTDLRGGGAAWELAGGLTWRPRHIVECSARAGVGDAFGRGSFDGDAVFARLEGVLRF